MTPTVPARRGDDEAALSHLVSINPAPVDLTVTLPADLLVVVFSALKAAALAAGCRTVVVATGGPVQVLIVAGVAS